KLTLFLCRKGRVEVIEVERRPRRAVADKECVLQLAAQTRGKSTALDYGADRTAKRIWSDGTVDLIQSCVLHGPCVTGISSERFVTSFAGQNHSHALTRQFCDSIERHAGRPDNRFIFMPDQPRQIVEELLPAEPHLVMFRSNMLRYLAREGQLTESFFSIADCECLDGLVAAFGGERGDYAGIKSAAEKNSERDVTHQVAVYALFEKFAIALHVSTTRFVVGVSRDREVPILLDRNVAAFVQFQRVSGEKLFDSLEK